MRVRDICVGIADGSHNPPQGIEMSDYLMLSSKNIFDDEITFDNPRYLAQSDFEQEDRRTKVMAGNVLLTIVGTVGRAAVVDEKMPRFTLQRSVAVLKPKDDVCNSRYLMYALQGKRTYIENSAKGVAQKGIYLNEVSDIDLRIPALYEQESIVILLDKITAVIRSYQKQIQKLDELVKSRFVEMFGKIEHEDSLENLCRFIDYRGKTPEKTDMGLPFITAKNVRMHHMSFETKEFISKETYDKVMTRGFPRVGDVVFTTEAPLGNVCRIPSIDTEFYIGQRIITMQTDSLEPAYLEYALASNEFRKKLNAKASGSTVTGIRSKLLEKLTIPVPPLELQNRFAAFIAEVDKSKLAVKQSLEKLETLKKSLMQQYFG